VTYACPLCGNEMTEHGTAGMACTLGHHFLAADIKGNATTVHHVRSREVRVPAWAPGAVVAALALLVAVADLIF
jgi:hypothetical protein